MPPVAVCHCCSARPRQLKLESPAAGICHRWQISRTSASLHFWRSAVFCRFEWCFWGGRGKCIFITEPARMLMSIFVYPTMSRPLAVLFMVAAWFTTVNLKYFYDAFRAEMHWGQDTHFNKRLRKNNKQKWGPLHLLHYIVLSRRRHKKTMTAESADVISRILFTLN